MQKAPRYQYNLNLRNVSNRSNMKVGSFCRLDFVQTVSNKNSRSQDSHNTFNTLHMDSISDYRHCVALSLFGIYHSLWAQSLIVFLVLSNHISCGHATQRELSYYLTEESEVGSFVANIREDAGLLMSNDAVTVRQFRYQFLSKPPTNFTMNESSSVISTSGRVDRDKLCPDQVQCILQLDVAIKPVQFFKIIKITVEILDINDNTPMFDGGQISHVLFESAPVGTGFLVPTASDPDSPKFSVISFELLADAACFELKVTEKDNGVKELRLVLIQPIDRESRDHYDMVIVAHDGGIPSKSGSLAVSITVGDANDNSPGFEKSIYEVIVPENAPINTLLLRVSATDPDEGRNGEVEYDFSEQTRRQHGQMFSVGRQSGAIRVQGTIDYEVESVYTLGVLARDRGQDSTPGDTTVIVRVEDVNDSPPQIIVNTLLATGTTKAILSEDSPVNTFLAHLTVQDPDSGDNGKFTCSLDDEYFRLERIYDTEYGIYTALPLDRESLPVYYLTLWCTDFGTPTLEAEQHINVTITDVNDNSPVFLQETYSAEILENNYIGVSLVQVSALDADTGQNARVEYHIEGEDAYTFSIGRHSGIVKARVSLDREKRDTYKFWITARDEGHPSMSSSVLLSVRVLDVNDVRPRFSAFSYSFGVTEERAAGEEVGTVWADDADGKPYNTFTFSLMASEGQTNAFYIGPTDGRISTTRPLDREEQAIYRLLVTATDVSTPSISSKASITLYVMDINDNTPVFIFPTKNNHTTSISNRTPLGSVITQVSASDKDIGNNSHLMYEISKGNREKFFSIGVWSAAVYLERDASPIRNRSFNLLIAVTDHGSPQRQETSELHIIVDSDIEPANDSGRDRRLSEYNFIIVAVVTSVGGLIIVFLCLAIIIIIRQYKRRHITGRYKERTDTLESLAARKALIDIKGKTEGECCQNRKFNPYVSEYSVNAVISHREECVAVRNGLDDGSCSIANYKMEYKKKHSIQRDNRDSPSMHSGDDNNTYTGQVSSETGQTVQGANIEAHLAGFYYGKLKSADYQSVDIDTSPYMSHVNGDHNCTSSKHERPVLKSFRNEKRAGQPPKPYNTHSRTRCTDNECLSSTIYTQLDQDSPGARRGQNIFKQMD